ncbi:uncharacterized protein DS421_11g325060 [Arachis hypogaea]|nr:uncharacterized protein DS421_11g325060 [Arachis hypogaea]
MESNSKLQKCHLKFFKITMNITNKVNMQPSQVLLCLSWYLLIVFFSQLKIFIGQLNRLGS